MSEITVSAVVWEDPPPTRCSGRKRLIGAEILELLRANPGRWGRLLVYERPDAAQQMRTRLGRYYQADGFEFTCRTVDGVTSVYGRYTGEDQDG